MPVWMTTGTSELRAQPVDAVQARVVGIEARMGIDLDAAEAQFLHGPLHLAFGLIAVGMDRAEADEPVGKLPAEGGDVVVVEARPPRPSCSDRPTPAWFRRRSDRRRARPTWRCRPDPWRRRTRPPCSGCRRTCTRCAYENRRSSTVSTNCRAVANLPGRSGHEHHLEALRVKRVVHRRFSLVQLVAMGNQFLERILLSGTSPSCAGPDSSRCADDWNCRSPARSSPRCGDGR